MVRLQRHQLYILQKKFGANDDGQVTYNGKKYQVTSTSGKVNKDSPTDAVALEITNKTPTGKGIYFW